MKVIYPPETVKRALFLYGCGYGYKAIARQLGDPQPHPLTVRRWIKGMPKFSMETRMARATLAALVEEKAAPHVREMLDEWKRNVKAVLEGKIQ